MKIVLISPPYINFGGIKESSGHGIPLNLLYLAAYTREKMPKAEFVICDAESDGLGYTEIKKFLKKQMPDIVGLTCPTPTMGHVLKIAEIAKTLNQKVVFVVGGSHPSAVPEKTAALPNIDAAIIGEGEETFYEIIKQIDQNKKEFSKINGIAFRHGKKIIKNPSRAPIENLDSIPFPARDLVDYKKYRSAPTKKVSSSAYSTSLLSSRGCPYNCTYCISKSVWNRRFRLRDPKKVVDEIKHCYDTYGLTEFNFYDDLLLLDPERIKKICNEILSRKLKISWICFSRANTVPNVKVLKLMKKAGCKKISLGLESGSQEILDNMRKGITLKQSKTAVDLITKAGLNAHASFMLGMLGETEETARKTIDFAKSLNLDNATFFITCPFPGTDIYENAKKLGFVDDNTPWEAFSPLSNEPPILCQNVLSGPRLVELQKQAFKEFYFRPKYLLRKLLQIRNFNDAKFILEGTKILFGILKKA